MEIADFSSPETDSGRAWLQPIGQEYEVEEVHILRNAHLALHPNITRSVFILFYPVAATRRLYNMYILLIFDYLSGFSLLKNQ